MRFIPWSKFTDMGEITHHAVLHRIDPGAVQPLHGHKFMEVFWGLKGECQHIINDHEEVFREGELILLRGNDIHELRGVTDKPFSYYLVSFPNSVFQKLKKQYFPVGSDLWGESADKPVKYKLPPKVFEWLNAAVQDLIGNPDDALAVDRFLMNLIFEIRRMDAEPYYACPAWLQHTLDKIKEPEYFQQGPRVFAELSGRSYEHISRVLKSHTGMKPTEYLNRARVEYAAARLVMTDIPISGIAFECGFGTLARFYNLFKKRYGLPPRQYRLRYRCLISASD